MNNEEFVKYLRGAAGHHLMPPVIPQKLHRVDERLGSLPVWLKDLLAYANGGDLFEDLSPFIILFSLQSDSPRGELFPEEWSIENYTQRWRSSGQREGLRHHELRRLAHRAIGWIGR